MTFTITDEDATKDHKLHFSIFDYQLVDAGGNIYERTSEGFSISETETGWKQIIDFRIKKDDRIQSPVTFTIQHGLKLILE